MAERQRLRLDALATIMTGATPPASQPDSWGDDVDFITPSDQYDGQRTASPSRRLSQIGAERLRKRLVPSQSTNLTCIGSTIGKVTMAAGPSITNQQINTLVAKPGIADPVFLYYMVKNWSGSLKGHASGSATPIVNKSVLSGYEFEVPGLPEQRAIAEVLGALDDKIAANTKLAETTDQLARLVYTSMLASSTETPLSKTADFVNGKAFTKGASGTGRVVVRIAELNSGIGGSTVYSDAEVEDKHIARAGDLLFAWSGSLTLHRWYRDDAIINQHIFKVIPRDGYPLWLVDQLLQSKIEHFKAVAADKATTMGHIQRRHLDEPVLVPSQDAIQENSVLMEGLWNLGLLAEQENEKLAATRDALLPQLMSGKLRVKDIKHTMGEMV